MKLLATIPCNVDAMCDGIARLTAEDLEAMLFRTSVEFLKEESPATYGKAITALNGVVKQFWVR